MIIDKVFESLKLAVPTTWAVMRLWGVTPPADEALIVQLLDVILAIIGGSGIARLRAAFSFVGETVRLGKLFG